MKQSMKKAAVAVGAFLLPALALAQAPQASYGITNAASLYGAIVGLLNAVIPIIVALAVIYIIWGIVQSFTTNDEEKRKGGHTHVLYGVVGLFVIVSIWGLVNILVNTAGLNGNTPTQGTGTGDIPTVTNL